MLSNERAVWISDGSCIVKFAGAARWRAGEVKVSNAMVTISGATKKQRQAWFLLDGDDVTRFDCAQILEHSRNK